MNKNYSSKNNNKIHFVVKYYLILFQIGLVYKCVINFTIPINVYY
jgi:hypothetical protein